MVSLGGILGLSGIAVLQTAPTFSGKPTSGSILSSNTMAGNVTPTAAPTPTPAPGSTPSPPKAATKPKLGNGASNALQTARSGSTPFGVAVGEELLGLSDSALNARFADIKAAGLSWIRLDIAWPDVAPNGPGQYSWGGYDRVARSARNAGIKVVGILDYTPPWARSGACSSSQFCAPDSPAQFGSYAGATAGHFAPLGINVWEIWNEPNIGQFYEPSPNPHAYVDLLKAAYPAIKQANSSATVLTAGLSPSGTFDGNYSPSDFLSQIYIQGGRGYFDAVAAHPYTYPDTPAANNPYDAWGQLTEMHNIMASRGDGGKLIWITEYGAPTGGPSSDPNDHISEAAQSTMLRDAIYSYRTLSWLGPMLFYTYQDSSFSTSTSENFYGLRRADGSAKPSYNTVKSLMAQLY